MSPTSLHNAWKRARRGLREDVRLYLVAITSLSIAFLCLDGALLALSNLGRLSDDVGRTRAVTLYLRDGVRTAEIEQLRLTLESLEEVEGVEHVDAGAARERFMSGADLPEELAGLPVEAFPASLEVALSSRATPGRIEAIAARVRDIGAVEDVETYQRWFDQLGALLSASRGAAGVIAILVLICVLAVVANTIRLAVANRRDEVEVMKLCGATHDFVRGPFLLEGAFQGFAASVLACGMLLAGFLLLRERFDATFAAFTGMRAAFLPPAALVALVLGGALVGAAGIAQALRRYLGV